MEDSQVPRWPLTPACRWMGERALRVDTGGATLARVDQLVSRSFEEVEDVIVADGSILLVFKPGVRPSGPLLAALSQPVVASPERMGTRHILPMRIGAQSGPDLEFCATHAGLELADFVREFTRIEFTVAFLGFQPGFPYLEGLPAHWTVPRHARPRVRVPAGSVALGGRHAGVYPVAGPGGWRVIGQTTAKLFDPRREPPALLAPGDRVCFELEA